MLRTVLLTERIAPGRRSGPSTSRATTPTTTNSQKPIYTLSLEADCVVFACSASDFALSDNWAEGCSSSCGSSFIELRKPLIAEPRSEPIPRNFFVPNSSTIMASTISNCQILMLPNMVNPLYWSCNVVLQSVYVFIVTVLLSAGSAPGSDAAHHTGCKQQGRRYKVVKAEQHTSTNQ